jgi:hypothetical protein
MYKIDNQISFEDFVFPYGALNKNNRWVKLANEIPWDKIEVLYAEMFVNNGFPAKNIRIALGCLIIKQTLNCSDEETVNQVMENPYLQFFIGLKEYTESAPFGASSMVAFRKRFSEDDILKLINEMVIDDEKSDDNDNNDKPNSGTIAIDATCAPADIAFPQDLKLLNDAREITENFIDKLHIPGKKPKPRTYRQEARKNFLNISKSKKKTYTKLRKAIRKQLGYIGRNFKYINTMLEDGGELSENDIEKLAVLVKLYGQQKSMHDEKKHSIPDRIVSICQPHIRPIPRGKAKAKTEFGAKVEISIIKGFARVETLSFDAYNEGGNLIGIVDKYKKRYGCYPERVLVDKLYRNRVNLAYCKEHGISITGPALGRPKKDTKIDKKQEYIDMCDRNCVEGKFGEGKTAYGLDRIAARLKNTSECVIRIIFLVMNLNKRLRNLLCQFLNWLFEWLFFDRKLTA